MDECRPGGRGSDRPDCFSPSRSLDCASPRLVGAVWAGPAGLSQRAEPLHDEDSGKFRSDKNLLVKSPKCNRYFWIGLKYLVDLKITAQSRHSRGYICSACSHNFSSALSHKSSRIVVHSIISRGLASIKPHDPRIDCQQSNCCETNHQKYDTYQ